MRLKREEKEKFLYGSRSLIHMIFRIEYKNILNANAAVRWVQVVSGSPQESGVFQSVSKREAGEFSVDSSFCEVYFKCAV